MRCCRCWCCCLCGFERLDLIDAGHFTWEDAADEDAAVVTSLVGRRLRDRRIGGSTVISERLASRACRQRPWHIFGPPIHG
jgi:hypothetical protein